MTIPAEQLHHVKDALADLGTRLVELENRIDVDNDAARRSLEEARIKFNVIARAIEPELVIAATDGEAEA